MKVSKVRVLLTDGQRTVDYAWLRHVEGKQIACGVPDHRDKWHLTYPADGKAHYTLRGGGRKRRRFLTLQPVPLRAFRGQRELLTLGFAPSTLEDSGLLPFRPQPQDALAFLDLRAFSDGMVWTSLGIVEPGQIDRLTFDSDVRQLLIVRNVVPWIYIAAGIKEGPLTF